MDKNILMVAIRAAIEAGAKIMSVYTDPNADFEIEKKADNSPLTIADRKAHEVISKILSSTNIPVLSEEGKKLPFESRKEWNEIPQPCLLVAAERIGNIPEHVTMDVHGVEYVLVPSIISHLLEIRILGVGP